MGFIRWLQKLLGMAAFSLIIVSLTLATSWYAVQFAFDRWMTESDSYLPSFLNSEKPESNVLSVMSTVQPIQEPTALPTDGIEATPVVSPSPSTSKTVPVPTNRTSNQTEKNKRDDVVVDAEQFSSAKNGLTNQEKLRIYELFIKRVPENQLKEVAGMLEGGISDKEITKLRSIIKTYFPIGEQEELESLGTRWVPAPTSSPKKQTN